MKRDPYKNQERYISWKKKVEEKGISEISKVNSDLILAYIRDMEVGRNITLGTKKGPRGFNRLISVRTRLVYLMRKFKEIYNIDDITKIQEEQLHYFFADMRNGVIKREDGGNYKSFVDFIKTFKAFWHWYIKSSRKEGREIIDITSELDNSREKPEWVYLTEEQIKKLCDNCKYEYKVLIMFLLDTGMRAPSELINIKVSDLNKDCKELNIRDEISKTFGRRIKLMLSSKLLKEFIRNNGLKSEDYIFDIDPASTNKYLKRLGQRIFGEELSPAGEKYSNLTMYDFRHCSCYYWLPRYKNENALKYRFGWKKSDKIHYYSELLGMKDTITEEDLLLDLTKTDMEKRLLESEKQNQILMEKMDTIQQQSNKGALLLADLQRKIIELQEAKQNKTK